MALDAGLTIMTEVAPPKKHTQNGTQFKTKIAKTLFLNVYKAFEAGHAYIAEILEYPPPQGQN